MSALSDYLENALLDHSLGKAAFTMPTVYVALFTTATSDAGGGTEVAAGDYARLATAAADWNAASGGAASNANALVFAAAVAAWGDITHIALVDASTAGNFLWHGALDASKSIGIGDTFRLAAGALDVSLA